jgi:hypothetical protein
MASNTQKNITKAMQKRRKDEQKAIGRAKKQLKSEAKDKAKKEKGKQKGGVVVASQKFQKASNDLFGLPAILWPFILLVCYQIARNTWEKKQQERDLEEARQFLRESRGFR